MHIESIVDATVEPAREAADAAARMYRSSAPPSVSPGPIPPAKLRNRHVRRDGDAEPARCGRCGEVDTPQDVLIDCETCGQTYHDKCHLPTWTSRDGRSPCAWLCPGVLRDGDNRGGDDRGVEESPRRCSDGAARPDDDAMVLDGKDSRQPSIQSLIGHLPREKDFHTPRSLDEPWVRPSSPEERVRLLERRAAHWEDEARRAQVELEAARAEIRRLESLLGIRSNGHRSPTAP
jgi:hypothetical protein